MATEINKPVNIFKELSRVISTSRTVQVVIVLIIIITVTATMLARAIFHHLEERKAENVAEQTAVANQTTFENSLFRFPATKGSRPIIALGTDLSSVPKPLHDAFMTHLVKLLASQSEDLEFSTVILLPAFYADGYFSSVNSGNLQILDSTNFFSRIRRLLTISPRTTFSDSSSVQEMRSCRLSFAVRMIQEGDTKQQAVLIKSTGAGFSDEASLEKAFQNISSEQLIQLKSLLQ